MLNGSRPKPKAAMSCRDVRMWHWHKVVSFRAKGRKHEARVEELKAQGVVATALRHDTSQARQAHGRADFHLKCVQAMNDIPSLQGSTAEQDYARFEKYVAYAD